jgi:outer membrane PBP1 activator LpoA protein
VLVGEDRPSYCALTSENVVESGGKQVTHMGTRMVYKIVVRGELSERYAMAFEGIEMEIENGQTVLTGEVKDQSHLHGILERIGASGLKLVSVENMSEN